MGTRIICIALLGFLGLPGCEAPPAAPQQPHYQLGAPYRAGGMWYYPRESFNAVETGLAAVATDRHPARTADGETYDATAMAAGHQMLQLPAIARVTNLETGVAVMLRINDRGPPRPHRLLELTPRAATLLGVPAAGGTRIRVEVMDAESRQAIDGLRGAPRLEIAAAPRGVVVRENLNAPAAAPVPEAEAAPPAQPTRLPEQRMQTAPAPGTLYIRLGSFSRVEFAERQRARIAQLSPIMETERDGRQTVYKLRIGPLATIASADAALDQAIRAGITDARIVVE